LDEEAVLTWSRKNQWWIKGEPERLGVDPISEWNRQEFPIEDRRTGDWHSRAVDLANEESQAKQ
jgi:hypothetical protein